MSVRFRKSINLGGGFKVNIGKNGITSFSWGTKGFRVTKSVNGDVRRTVSIPGTGISFTDTIPADKSVPQEEVHEPVIKYVNKWTYCLLAILLGTFGAHKFYSGKKKAGIIYLCFFWSGFTLLLGIIEGIWTAIFRHADERDEIGFVIKK